MTLALSINADKYSSAFSLGTSSHLWLLDLTQLTADVIIHHQACLSPAELLRAQAFKQRHLQFLATRAFVRLCLARYTLTPPHTLTVATERNGKPYLIDAPLPIVFNLSHSQDMAVLAVGLQHPVGIDIETTTRKRSQIGIAERYFHPTEVAQLKQLADTEQRKYFFQLWTLKEAFLKATGLGISCGLDKVAFNLQENSIQAELAPELNTKAEDWQFYQTFINMDYCVALARHTHKPLSVHWFDGSELFSTSAISDDNF